MPLEAVPTDAIADDLIRTYQRGTERLANIVRLGLERGLDPTRLGTPEQIRGDATAAYRARQLSAARAIVAELERTGARAAPVIARRAYESAIFAVDRHAYAGGAAELANRFGGVHQRAVAALAGNMSASLTEAARRAGTNVGAVFARADALEAGVPPRGFPFLGRRVDDPWRRVALDTVGEGIVALDTRRQVSAQLIKRLVNEGITDATTGFVDRAGRRWGLDAYAAMVGRTTTREATSRATVNRLLEHELELVTISSHPHAADECTPYDGQTFSLSGSSEEYDELDKLPPFHPNCRHVVTPAGANLDRFERDLTTAVEDGLGPDDVTPPAPAGAPPSPGTPTPATELAAEAGGSPPFSDAAVAMQDAGTPARLEAERTRALIEGDPGPDLEAELARDAEHDRIARMNKRAEGAYLREQLGEDLAPELERAWARNAGIRERFLAGDLSVEDVEHAAYANWQEEEARRLARDLDKHEAGFRRGSIPCFVCGRRKPRPSSVCDFCGDDPVTYGGSAAEFDRAYGYSGGARRSAGFD